LKRRPEASISILMMLQSEFSGIEGDRIHTVNYRATDDAGNATDVQATETVPRIRPR
jgi:hypothetical protein